MSSHILKKSPIALTYSNNLSYAYVNVLFEIYFLYKKPGNEKNTSDRDVILKPDIPKTMKSGN